MNLYMRDRLKNQDLSILYSSTNSETEFDALDMRAQEWVIVLFFQKLNSLEFFWHQRTLLYTNDLHPNNQVMMYASNLVVRTMS